MSWFRDPAKPRFFVSRADLPELRGLRRMEQDGRDTSRQCDSLQGESPCVAEGHIGQDAQNHSPFKSRLTREDYLRRASSIARRGHAPRGSDGVLGQRRGRQRKGRSTVGQARVSDKKLWHEDAECRNSYYEHEGPTPARRHDTKVAVRRPKGCAGRCDLIRNYPMMR